MEEDHPKINHDTITYIGGFNNGKYQGQATQSALRRSQFWIATNWYMSGRLPIKDFYLEQMTHGQPSAKLQNV
jgi:hypothetical protein|tara:strand:- start:432 stop:650 length:219 start_codon:yes stop_codon:yes gene_type:complete